MLILYFLISFSDTALNLREGLGSLLCRFLHCRPPLTLSRRDPRFAFWAQPALLLRGLLCGLSRSLDFCLGGFHEGADEELDDSVNSVSFRLQFLNPLVSVHGRNIRSPTRTQEAKI